MHTLQRDYSILVEMTIPANGYAWFVITDGREGGPVRRQQLKSDDNVAASSYVDSGKPLWEGNLGALS